MIFKSLDGEWIEKEKEIMLAFRNYFQDLFASRGVADLEVVLGHVDKKITEVINRDLIAEIRDEEITTIVFQLGSTKAPRLDGFSRLYQSYWDVVGKSIVVFSLFTFGQLVPCINSTGIILIPKV